jgi:hypothetical protein
MRFYPWGLGGPSRFGLLSGLALLLGLLPTSSALAWTPSTQLAIAREAIHLAPPDLARQIERRRRVYEEGVIAPFRTDAASFHEKNPDGSGELDRVISAKVQEAVRAIREHRTFDEIVRRLGEISHYVADANNPLNTSANDPAEARFFADYLFYAESAEDRFALVFYGLDSQLERGTSVRPLVERTLARSRSLYPLLGREYRRVDFASGRSRFDDRSTAFGIASVSFSHAVSDVALVMRYIWIQAGGGDSRTYLPSRGDRLLRIPRRDDIESSR